MWDVPQFSIPRTGRPVQQAFNSFDNSPGLQGYNRQGGQGAQPQGHPTAASSVDANGNVVATQGQNNPMFRQGSVMGTFFPDAQKMNGTDWGAAIGRLMGFGG